MMRNSKGRMFLYILLLCIVCVVVFLLSSTHSHVKELEGMNEKCQQQRDSLSAQLQVVYEHKNRLEKSLQQEKTDHRHTKEEIEKQYHELQIRCEREKEKQQTLQNQLTQIQNSYSQLEEDKTNGENALKEKLHGLENNKNGEVLKLQAQISDLLGEKEKLEQGNSDYKLKLQQHMSDLSLCQLQYQQLERKLSSISFELKRKHLNDVDDMQSFKETEVLSKGIINDKGGSLQKQEIQTQKVKDNASLLVTDSERDYIKTEKSIPKDNQKALKRPNIIPFLNNKINKAITQFKSVKEEWLQNANSKQQNIEKYNGKENNSIKKVADKEKFDGTDKQGNSEIRYNGSIDFQDQIKELSLKNQNTIVGKFSDTQDEEKVPNGEKYNLPQVQPPNNFEQDPERDGNLFHQAGDSDARHQLEEPVFKINKAMELSEKKGRISSQKFARYESKEAEAVQRSNMIEKLPADDSLGIERNHFNIAHHEFEVAPKEDTVNNFKRGSQFINQKIEDHLPNDKHYVEDGDDDDQEGDNDDEQLIGGQVARGKIFQDNDFEDQDNVENNQKNALKQEEGVMVAPK